MIAKKNILAFLLLILFFSVNAQDFQLTSANLISFANGGMNWGDYNRDGALDLLLNGNIETGPGATSLFKNHNGQFSEVTANLPPLYGGSALWGDFDNDDDLDVLICGTNPAGDGKTLLYRNNNGLFVLTDANLTGLSSGEAIWLDYNNDGNLDILITGDSSYNTPVTKLYRNNGNNTFSWIHSALTYAQQSFVTAGDYDNDGDADILLSGACSCDSAYVTKLFRNDSGTFVESGIPLLGIGYGDGIFLDYDNDGDQDIIVMGSTINSDYVVKIYRNEGSDQFSDVPNPIEGEWTGHIDATDINNDGYSDLGITGSLCCGDALTSIYLNDTSGNFTLHPGIFPALYYSQVNFGDYDNDGDADFSLTGNPPDGPGTTFSGIFQNRLQSNSFTINTAPAIPSGMTSMVDGNNVMLHWDASTDNSTPTVALTYNLRVGLSPSSMEIMAPLSDPLTGFSKVYTKGNCGQITSHFLKGLPNNTYYWSVQALDHSGAASGFAPVQSVEIGSVGITVLPDGNNFIRIFPNPVSDLVNIVTSPDWKDAGFALSGITGNCLYQGKLTSNRATLDISSYPSGLYYIAFSKGQNRIRLKLLIQ